MTKEQIEKAQRFATDGMRTVQPGYTPPLVQRLLAERERLLDGAKLIAAQMCEQAGCAHRACAQAAIARTALAYAEEAAP